MDISPADITGIVFNIQRYSVQDGPGIRTTVFVKGCPLSCRWCSNPESQNPKPEIAHRDSVCNQCGDCISTCGPGAISIAKKGIAINRKLCTNCGKCIEICIPGALQMYGETMTVTAVFEKVMKDEEFYRNSDGGVTVSGGESLAQPEFVAALFKLCRSAGLNTCIETSGCASPKALEMVLPYTSLVLYDIKMPDSEGYRKYTFNPNPEVLHNLQLIVNKHIPVIIRVPLIPGINDSPIVLEKIARIAVEYLSQPGKVELLPYHKFGMGKYPMLDREYTLSELNTQNEAEQLKAKELFESFGLHCDIVL